MSEESGKREITEADRKKAAVFFQQAKIKAAAAQFDYAISMYLDGFKYDPEAVDKHQELRDVALKRKVSGGKDLGMIDRMKMRYGKDDLINMIMAEKFLAFDPGNTGRMLELLQYAAKADCLDTVLWIGPLLMRANVEASKPQVGIYLALKDAYIAARKWQLATDAAQRALAIRPGDMDLQTEVKNLGARQTIEEGSYDKKGGNFMNSMRNADEQKRLMTEDTDARTADVLVQQINYARKEYELDTNEPGKITKLIDALVKTELPDNENEAIAILEAAHKRTGQFRYRLRVGEIKMQQLKRMERSMRQDVAKSPKDVALIKDYNDFVREKTEVELNEFQLAADAYPTDIRYKYEAARRMFLLKRYPEAIPLLQQAVQDPKFRTDATIDLARAFLEAEFVDEAIDTLKGLGETYQMQGDVKYKEIWYWYGRALETRGDTADAIKSLSKVAMADFNYRDVQVRIKALRSKGQTPSAT